MNIFNPNTDQINDFYEKGKFILAWRLSLLFGFVFIILSFTFINSTLEEALIYAICALIAVGAILYLHLTKKSKPIYIFLSFSGSIIAMYSTNSFPDLIHIGDFLWFVLIVLFATFGLGKKWGYFFLSINIFAIIYYTIFSVNDNIVTLKTLSLIERIGLAVEISIATLSLAYVTFQFLKFHQFTYNELKQQNEIIIKQNDEKNSLVQEVHHRVKNNLQIIISLLRLQSNELKSEEAKLSLTEAINRIMVMSLIHQKLYGTKSLSNINLKDYLNELFVDIKNVYNSKDITIKINSNYNVGLKTIVPLGLLFNELITNSLKHAFMNKENGEINITIKQKVGRDFEVFYSDNGEWIEQDDNHKSFGIELIEIMTSQLEGDFEKLIDDSTNYVFFLKDIDEEDKRPLKEQLNINDND